METARGQKNGSGHSDQLQFLERSRRRRIKHRRTVQFSGWSLSIDSKMSKRREPAAASGYFHCS